MIALKVANNIDNAMQILKYKRYVISHNPEVRKTKKQAESHIGLACHVRPLTKGKHKKLVNCYQKCHVELELIMALF